ncbi:hypothetical protein EDB38_1285 [Vibrio crassostreae]|nr:hypothetical protein EDB52_1298 [Vibrio crassostreae]TCN00131.1 hypothetical protein EDB35_1455 [Vibrio crassostreae]TCT41957.1 hypothetical protein EDB39_1355 [Vibrio crassostreae]TCT45651.1 hypothetical protein EDB42_1295 [Vibrio crassostreae]TCT47622.1 hypothetical protein EDB40_1348 [Vibrio crassostreae]
MGNSKAKITNWSQYNRALCKRGDVLFGLMIQPLKHGNVPRTMGIEAEGSKTQVLRLKKPL